MAEGALADRPPAGELLALDGLAPGDRRLRHRRRIIDPEALDQRITELWGETGEPGAFRTGLLAVLRETLDAGRAEIRGGSCRITTAPTRCAPAPCSWTP